MLSTTPDARRLLAGPSLDGPEPFADHVARLGPLPTAHDAQRTIGELEASGLLGRGGAGFPVGRKWRAMAERSRGHAVVLANGAEGEPASLKDRVLMAARPHLVIDGAILAADAVGANDVVFYVGREHESAIAALGVAIEQRRPGVRHRIRMIEAPIGYVAGEASGAVHFVNAGDPRPTTTPPRMSERGVNGRPTLVQNVESLAHAALIARFGAGWYREAGRGAARGTALITLSGAGRPAEVIEIELGTPLGEVVAGVGASPAGTSAVLLGGYFGTWAPAAAVWSLPLDPAAMREAGLTFGCGMVGLLPARACGVDATARIMSFMARESAGQCGPCLFGLRALAEASRRVADGRPRPDDMDGIARWTQVVAGRGACHHPDGAVALMASALRVFGEDMDHHARTGRCLATPTVAAPPAVPATPVAGTADRRMEVA
jgi:NADH:ubiquinone oxidoreductase subunit F (NADH-binding)